MGNPRPPHGAVRGNRTWGILKKRKTTGACPPHPRRAGGGSVQPAEAVRFEEADRALHAGEQKRCGDQNPRPSSAVLPGHADQGATAASQGAGHADAPPVRSRAAGHNGGGGALRSVHENARRPPLRVTPAPVPQSTDRGGVHPTPTCIRRQVAGLVGAAGPHRRQLFPPPARPVQRLGHTQHIVGGDAHSRFRERSSHKGWPVAPSAR
jgi:hypothetical protein